MEIHRFNSRWCWGIPPIFCTDIASELDRHDIFTLKSMVHDLVNAGLSNLH